MLIEPLDYNLSFRWFVALNMDDPIWDLTVFTKNRERQLDRDIAEAFFGVRKSCRVSAGRKKIAPAHQWMRSNLLSE